MFLSRHVFGGAPLTVSRYRHLINRVTSCTGRSVRGSVDLFRDCSRSRSRRVVSLRGLASGCRSGLNACLIGLDDGGLSGTSSRTITHVLRSVNSLRHVNSRTLGVYELTSRVRAGNVSFSSGTGRRLSIVSNTVGRVITLAISSFGGSGPVSTTRVRPLRRIVSNVGRGLGTLRVSHLRGGSYAVRLNFVFARLLAGFRHISSRYSGVTIFAVRLPNSGLSTRGCLGTVGSATGERFASSFSACSAGCDLGWGWRPRVQILVLF